VFTYEAPADGDYELGMRVLAPFGGRSVEGYIIGFKKEPGMDAARVKPLTRPLEDFPALTGEQIDLAVRMREQCKCTLSSALRLMIPAQMRGGRVRIKTGRIARLKITGPALDMVIESQQRAPKRRELLETLRDMGGQARVSELGRGSSDALRKLSEAGVIELTTGEVRRAPAIYSSGASKPRPELTPAQRRALDELCMALDGGGRFLLHGVTGSGKTEVYMRLIEELLARGRTAILLVPEISLTPQMAEQFSSRFGDMCALLHSRLSAGERYDEWRRIRSGEARVVIGARSAVFAPVENLGAVIIDEEHESSYLSDKHPSYDAREVAAWRCASNRAVLLLGSATPSVATYMRTLPGVKPENRLTLIEMLERVNRRALPEVSIVDMRKELLLGNRSIFSGALKRALEETFDAGEQAILFLNRRGYSTFVSCRSCGYVEKCENCDVTMTYHQYDDKLRCHYCGAERAPRHVCPECGSPYIKYFGIGTQKVEQEINEMFPRAGVVRMDADTTSGKDAHARLLHEFGSGGKQALIGTQMVAKGLDFPRVTLVGVIAADTSLNLPDYRAFERTFQLITQAAGRAGRAERPGRVIVQSYEPDHYAIQLAAAQDYRAFFTQEAGRRRQGLYPPFTIIARLLIEGKDGERVERTARELESSFLEFLNQNEVMRRQIVQMRAMEAPLKLIRGMTRWQVFAKLYARGPSDGVLDFMAGLEEERARERGEVTVTLEISPASIL
jgi:primosomal protein N' (replication factor Y)